MSVFSYEVWYKHGDGWVYTGERRAKSPRAAAQMAGYVYHRRILRVRLAGTELDAQVFRFKSFPEPQDGRASPEGSDE